MENFECTMICLNGHLINRFVNLHPEDNKKHRPECGQSTIHQCPACNKEIEGRTVYNEATDSLGYNLRKSKKHQYCEECGAAYPWTKSKFESAKELIRDLEGLSDEKIVLLRDCIEDVLRGSSKSETDTAQFIEYMIEAEGPAINPLQTIINDVASDAVKTRLQVIDVKRKMKKSRRKRLAQLESLKRRQSPIKGHKRDF